jgi:hypothetical protein
MFPDILCIGAQKAGTTWLYEVMKCHHEIEVPFIKEIHYFDNTWPETKLCRNIGLYRRFFDSKFYNKQWRRHLFIFVKHFIRQRNLKMIPWGWHYFFNRRNDNWYGKLFLGSSSYSIDITPTYGILEEEKVKHIKNLIPDAKIILIMRNPIDRSWSHARMQLLRRAKKSIKSIKNEEFIDFFNSERCLLNSDYPRMIRIWEKYFKGQIHYDFYEEFLTNKENFLARIYNFIGVNTNSYIPPNLINKRVNFNPNKHEIPDELYQYLASKYINDLKFLANRFGSYPLKWYNEALKAI